MPQSKNCCTCQKVFLLLAVIVVLGVVGGVLAWKFVPGTSEKVGELVPPPTTPETNAYKFNQCTDSDTDNCCNGLSGGMCDLRADEIMWAMPHNSAATSEDGMVFSPNHKYNLAKALPAGYRGINLDVCNCGGELVLCHGYCSLWTLDMVGVFRTLIDFLTENPTEMLLLTLELNSEADQEVDVTAVEALLASSVPGLTDMLYVRENLAQEWPTLRAMKELDQRMLLFHYNGNDCQDGLCPSGFHYWFASAVETPFEFSEPADIEDTANSCALDRGRLNKKNFFGVNVFTSSPLPDRADAQIVNEKSFLNAHIDACSAMNDDLDVNVVIVDFWDEGDVIEVVQERNKALAAAQRRRRVLGKK